MVSNEHISVVMEPVQAVCHAKTCRAEVITCMMKTYHQIHSANNRLVTVKNIHNPPQFVFSEIPLIYNCKLFQHFLNIGFFVTYLGAVT